MMLAAVVELSQQATDSALENRDEWPEWAIENYSVERYRDITVHSWGYSLEHHGRDRLSPPHLDRLGRAMPLAVTDGYLFISNTEDHIRSMVDTRLDEADSLADIPEYKLAAQGMNGLSAVMAVIMDETHVSENMRSTVWLIRPRITNYLTIGMGPGKDEKGVYMAFVLVYENNANAEKGVSALEQKIDYFNVFCEKDAYSSDNLISSSDIRTEGRVLLAKLYTADETLWRYWFFNQWEMTSYEEMMDEMF